MIDATFFGPMSALVQEKLNNITNTELFSTIMAMSGAPVIPWENLKWQYFGPDYKDYKFQTIHEIEVDPGFDNSTASATFSAIAYDLCQTAIQQISALNTTSLTATKNIYEMDPEFVKSQIKFVEAVHSVTPDLINERPYEVAQKLVSFYIQTHKK